MRDWTLLGREEFGFREYREQLRASCGRVEMTFRFDGQLETHGVQEIEKTLDFGISPSR